MYRYFSVINEIKHYKSLPAMLKESAPALDFNWLISIDAVKSYSDFMSYFGLDDADVLKSIMLDSGGYSLCGNRSKITSLDPILLANVATQQKVGVVVSPDIPLRTNEELNSALAVTEQRCRLFYENIEKVNGAVCIDAIQGFTQTDSGEYTLDNKLRWVEKIANKDINKGLSDGYGVPLIDESVFSVAFYSLLPWYLGASVTHAFGRGDFKSLLVLIYIDTLGLYDKLSSDSTTYTQHTSVKNLQMLDPQSPYDKKAIYKLGAKYYDDDKKYVKCGCPVCTLYSDKYGYYIYEQARHNKNGKSGAASLLREWLCGHNVYAVQNFIESMKGLAGDKHGFIDYIKSLGFNDVVFAIELVDEVIAGGKKQYEQNVKLVGSYDHWFKKTKSQ